MNLFDVTRGIAAHIGPRNSKKANDKPRKANDSEVKAYLIWLADRRGLWLPHDAEYQPAGVWSKSAGEYVLPMPGYDQDQTVTMETLDEAGEVLTSQTLPVEPKKGGVIWDKAAVRKACGPIAKPAKAKRGKVADPIAVAVVAPVAVETQEASPPALDKPEPAIAPSVPPAVDLESIAARIEALETALAALSVTPAQAPIAEPAEERPKRTPAHDRAIRTAWAERKSRRRWQEINRERIERLTSECDTLAEAARDALANLGREAKRADDAERERERLIARGDEWEALQHRTWTESMGHKAKRRATAQRARRMIAAARARADLDARALAITNANLSRLKRDMADPMQPERASDIARLVGERDTARTALAAMAARAERAEQTVDAMADRFEGLVSRVTRAEAALRQASAA